MIINCKRCFELGYECSKCKEKNKKALSRREFTEKVIDQIKKRNQKRL